MNRDEYHQKRMRRRQKSNNVIFTIVYFAFIFWSVSLALQVPGENARVLHILFALLFPPGYVLSHYLSRESQKL